MEWAGLRIRVVPVRPVIEEWARVATVLRLPDPATCGAELRRMEGSREWPTNDADELRGVVLAFACALELATRHRLPLWIL